MGQVGEPGGVVAEQEVLEVDVEEAAAAVLDPGVAVAVRAREVAVGVAADGADLEGAARLELAQAGETGRPLGVVRGASAHVLDGVRRMA